MAGVVPEVAFSHHLPYAQAIEKMQVILYSMRTAEYSFQVMVVVVPLYQSFPEEGWGRGESE